MFSCGSVSGAEVDAALHDIAAAVFVLILRQSLKRVGLAGEIAGDLHSAVAEVVGADDVTIAVFHLSNLPSRLLRKIASAKKIIIIEGIRKKPDIAVNTVREITSVNRVAPSPSKAELCSVVLSHCSKKITTNRAVITKSIPFALKSTY